MKNDYAKEYAIALFDLSLEKKLLETMKDELIIISSAFIENAQFDKLLSHPQISKEQKKDIVKDVFKGINSSLLYFLYVVIENDRIEDIEFINEEFRKLYNEYNQVMQVEAVTTIPLDKNQREALVNKLSLKYRHKIEIHNVIDHSIGGGMRISINNQVMDYTIKSQLENLKMHILKQT